MKPLLLFGTLCGMLLTAGVLVWWSFTSVSLDLPPSAPAPGSSGLSKSKPASQAPPPTAPLAPISNSAPVPAAQPSEEDLPERRCLELAQRDPRAAVAFAIDTLPKDMHPGLLENLTAQWAMRDFQAAHEWVLQQRPSEWRDGLMARVAFAGSQSDPAGAARLVVEEMSPGQRQTEAAISVLHQWALHDPDAAAAWAVSFPEGELRTRAMAEIEGVRKSRQSAVGGL